MSIALPMDPTIVVHETRLTHVWLEHDGIVRCLVKPRHSGTLEDARRETEIYRALGQGHRIVLLVDLSQAVGVTHDFRTHMAGPEGSAVMAAGALLIGSPTSRVIGNFIRRLNPPAYPLKLFTDEAQALAWLKTFLG